MQADDMDKRSVLNRMHRVATNIWDVKDNEMQDPLVSLFIESLADEICRLSTEIENVESRMLGSLSGMICSDIALSAGPAHCILHATPDEGEVELSKETPFLMRNKKQLPENMQQLSFYPVCQTKIRKGGVRYIIHGGLLYQIEEDQSKTLVSRSRNTKFGQERSCWIALEMSVPLDPMINLSFYFDLPGMARKNEYLKLLPHMKWKLNGKDLGIRQGLYTIDNKSDNDIIGLFDDLDIAESLDRHILQFYEKHFVTIVGDRNLFCTKEIFPEELAGYFPQHLLEGFSLPLVWLNVEYPSSFTQAVMEAMVFSVNAFPVANKNLHTKTVDVGELLKIIPLETTDHESLLAVHSVSDVSGKRYYELPFDDTSEQCFGTYSMRRGGYERYQKRDASEYLTNLADMLESHSSVKSGDSSPDGAMKGILSGVHHLVSHIRKSVSLSDEKLDIQSYILIDHLDQDEVFFVKYWTTNGDQANRIKSHAVLDCLSSNTYMIPSSVYTLTATTGGRYAPLLSERQLVCRKLMSDSSILVTNDDIILFCKHHFGDMLAQVKVSKGIIASCGEEGTFVHTTDIMLTPQKRIGQIFNDIELFAFEQDLRRHSPATFNYRIYIDEHI